MSGKVVRSNPNSNAPEYWTGSEWSAASKLLGVVTPEQYGAVADGVVNDASAIQAAADAAARGGLALHFVGAYAAASTITIRCGVSAAPGASLTSTAAVAVKLGATGTPLLRKNIALPAILRPVEGTGIGVLFAAAGSNQISLPYVFGFADGVSLAADGEGVAYNTVTIGHLQNYRNMVFRPVNQGWSNQNTIIGGRWVINHFGGILAGSRQVLIGSPDTYYMPDGNVFLNCSLEGDAPEYHLECFGSDNRFYGCRWEVTVGTPRVRWSDDGSGIRYAERNVIDGGFMAGAISATAGTYTRDNLIRPVLTAAP